MRRPPDGVEDAPQSDLDPEIVLDRDSRVLLDPRFLAALHRELLEQGDRRGAVVTLLRMGFLHGMQDALRVRLARRHEHWTPPLTLRCRGVPGPLELRGDWPERREAAARLREPAEGAGCCAFSAGYTSGWLSAMLEADVLVVEERCGGARGGCRFVAREASRWRPEELPCGFQDAIPFRDFRSLVRSRVTSQLPDELAPPLDLIGIDRDAACVHIWGPLMVIPFGGPDDGLHALDLIGRDPEAAQVSVVIVHLGHTLIDEAFGALALEQILHTAESWGAETLIAEPSALCERVIAELSTPPLLVMKNLEEAVLVGLQIARSQRRLC